MATAIPKAKRKTVIIAGDGAVPVMFFSLGEPECHGADTVMKLTLETPSHRYRLQKILRHADYMVRSKTGRFPTFNVMALWATTYDPKAGFCYIDRDARLSNNHMTAVQWQDGSWEAKVVDVEELSTHERMVHHQTLNREAGDGGLRKEIARVSIEVSKNIPVFVKLGDKLNRIADQNRELCQQLQTGIERIETIDSQQVSPKKRWWENVLARYERQPESVKSSDRWLEVARVVVEGAILENKKQRVDRHSDYLTARRLNRLILELVTGSKTEIIKRLAVNLRVSSTRERNKMARAGRRA